MCGANESSGRLRESFGILPPGDIRNCLAALSNDEALLTHLARLAMGRGCGRMEWSVLTWNEPAIGFYKRLGAVPMDGWQVYRLAGDALNRLGR